MRWFDAITNLMDNEFEQAPGVGDGQGSLACCSPWGHIESDMTEQLNNKSLSNLAEQFLSEDGGMWTHS